MPDLRAFLGVRKGGIERRHTSPCLGDIQGHIGPVDALPDSASELMVSLLGKARAEPAQQLYHFNLGETEAEPALTSIIPLGCKQTRQMK